MREIEGIELVRQKRGEFHWSDYGVLRKLSMEYDVERRGYKLHLWLSTWDDDNDEEIHVECTGAVHVVINGSDSGVIMSSGFMAEDISDRQWDKIQWEFFDYENGYLKFYCQNIKIVSVRDCLDEESRTWMSDD